MIFATFRKMDFKLSKELLTSRPSSHLFHRASGNAASSSALSTSGETPKTVYKNKLRIKWSESFMPCYLREDWEKLALNHSLQDVLTPFAILIKISLEITELRGQADNLDENIFLTMNEALELCVSKAPADIRNTGHGHLARVTGKAKLINWINDGAIEYCTPFQFNGHALIQRIRRA
jgi:hypothetical protein